MPHFLRPIDGATDMATRETQFLARTLLTPAVVLLFVWMIVPLALTIYFSTLHYNLLEGGAQQFVGLDNYRYFLTDPAFLASLQNTLVLVGSVLGLTILLGIGLALLLDQPVIGRSIVRLMVIAPFFVMPTVSALVWKDRKSTRLNSSHSSISYAVFCL